MSNLSLISQLRKEPPENNAQTIRDLLSQGFSYKEIKEKTKLAKSYIEKVILAAPEFNKKVKHREATRIAKSLLVGQPFYLGDKKCTLTGYPKDSKGNLWIRFINESGRVDTISLDGFIKFLEVEL